MRNSIRASSNARKITTEAMTPVAADLKGKNSSIRPHITTSKKSVKLSSKSLMKPSPMNCNKLSKIGSKGKNASQVEAEKT